MTAPVREGRAAQPRRSEVRALRRAPRRAAQDSGAWNCEAPNRARDPREVPRGAPGRPHGCAILPRPPQVHVMLKAAERAAAEGYSCECIDLATI
eukprot:3938915-Prymnesium_polylepis.1